MLSPEDIYVMDLDTLHENLYRMGNSTSPNFSEGRTHVDCRVVDRVGIKVVLANGNGFSAFNRIIGAMKIPGKSVWRLNKGAMLPAGIKLVKDLTNPGHYMLAPAEDMPLTKYLGFLQEMAINPQTSVKLTPQEVVDASSSNAKSNTR